MPNTRKTVIKLLGLLLLAATGVYAQALDPVGGRMDISCPLPPHYLAFTGGTLTGTSGAVTVAGASSIYAANEPIIITGTGTALDYIDDKLDVNRGAAVITSVVGTTINFTNHLSGTVSNAMGHIQPGREHIETVTDPYGTGPKVCTYFNHEIFLQGVAAACGGLGPLSGGNCSFNSATVSSASQTGGVVTMTQGTTTAVTTGENISITNCVDTTYNGTFQAQSTSSPNIFTYNKSTTNSSTSGCKVSAVGWRSKYTTDCASAQWHIKRYQDVGYNAIFEDSDKEMLSGQGACTPISGLGFMLQVPPANIVFSQNQYSSANFQGNAPQATIILTFSTVFGNQQGFDRVYTEPIRGAAHNLDWFSPNFSTYFINHWGTQSTNLVNMMKSPLSTLALTDDSDHQNITLGDAFFTSFPRAKNNYNAAFLVAIAASHQSYFSVLGQQQGSNAQIYPDNIFYSKHLSASPPAGCWNSANPSQFLPCSWPDFVRNKYGTIGAANTAWGSNYTTLGSSETVHTQVLEATGNGSATSFSIALGANVTPGSVQIYIKPSGGSATDSGGDCPDMWIGCTGSVGATLGPAPNCTGYNSTHVQDGLTCVDTNGDIEFVATGGTGNTGTTPAWPNAGATCTGTQTTTWGSVTATCYGPALVIATSTLTYTTGNGTLTFTNAPTTQTYSMSWTNGGWDASGTGLTDEDGSNTAWVGTNPLCIIHPAARLPNHTYTAYDLLNAASIIEDPVSGTWQIATTTGTTGAGGLPPVSANRGNLTTDGGVVWVSEGSPVCSATIANADFPNAIDANPTYALDLQGFLQQYAARYFKTEYEGTKQIFPDLLAFGTDFSMFSYSGPEDMNTAIAQNAYTDGAFAPLPPLYAGNTNGSSGNMGLVALKAAELYYHKPFVNGRNWMVGTDTITGAPSWQNNFGSDAGCDGGSLAVPPNCSRSTNGVPNANLLRAQVEYLETQQQLTLTNQSGQTQSAGYAWWGFGGDFQQSPFGATTNLDNLADGHENVTAAVNCSGSLSAFTCGGELPGVPWLGIDVINGAQGVKAMNALWLAPFPPPTTAPCLTCFVGSNGKDDRKKTDARR